MVAQQYEYIQRHLTMHLEMVNFTLYIFYHNF